MTLAPSNPIATRPTPRGVGWITIDTACQRSGWSTRKARRQCREVWSAEGLAELRKPSSGGRAQWYIREDADPVICRYQRHEVRDLQFDWSEWTKAQQDELVARRDTVNAWERYKSDDAEPGMNEREAVQCFLLKHATETGQKIGRTTLLKWVREYRQHGIGGLIDGRWMKAKRESSFTEFFGYLKRCYLEEGNNTLTVCYKVASAYALKQGWDVPTYETARLFINSIPAGVIAKTRGGSEAFTNQAEPYVERDYTTLDSNGLWCSDHHQFDVMVEHRGKPVRPWLTVWMDIRSRLIVGWSIYAHAPNSQTVLDTFADGCESFGIPQHVLTDNGEDYKANAVTGGGSPRNRKQGKQDDEKRIKGVFNKLGIDVTWSLPYHPQSKPVERFFKTVEDRFGKTWKTYCGNSPANRPEKLQRKLKTGQAPDLATFSEAFGEWLDADYHHRQHTGQGMEGQTPAVVFADCLETKRTTDTRVLRILCMREVGPVKVTRNGVRFQQISYQHDDLFELLGREVMLHIDGSNRGIVYVMDLDGRFICIAEQIAKVPFISTDAQVREAMREKAKVRRKVKEYTDDVKPRATMDMTDHLIEAARKDKAQQPRPTDPTPTIRPVNSELDGQGMKIQAAQDRVNGVVPRKRAKRNGLAKFQEAVQEQESKKPKVRPRDLMAELVKRNAAS